MIAQSAESGDVVDAVIQCKSVENAEDRLACYDNAVGRFEDAQKSGDLVTISKSEVENVQKDAFGFELPSLPKLGRLFGRNKSDSAEAAVEGTTEPEKLGFNDVKFVELDILRTERLGNGRTKIYLVNGQEWVQRDDKRVKIYKAKGGRADYAQIKKASLGSYLMRINDKGQSIRVQRIK